MVIKKYTLVEFTYIPLTRIMIGGKKIICLEDGSKIVIYKGINKIINSIKQLADIT